MCTVSLKPEEDRIKLGTIWVIKLDLVTSKPNNSKVFNGFILLNYLRR